LITLFAGEEDRPPLLGKAVAALLAGGRPDFIQRAG
jgi:hypothetical protein